MGTSIRLEKELGLSLGEKTNTNEQTKTNKAKQTNENNNKTLSRWYSNEVKAFLLKVAEITPVSVLHLFLHSKARFFFFLANPKCCRACRQAVESSYCIQANSGKGLNFWSTNKAWSPEGPTVTPECQLCSGRMHSALSDKIPAFKDVEQVAKALSLGLYFVFFSSDLKRWVSSKQLENEGQSLREKLRVWTCSGGSRMKCLLYPN